MDNITVTEEYLTDFTTLCYVVRVNNSTQAIKKTREEAIELAENYLKNKDYKRKIWENGKCI